MQPPPLNYQTPFAPRPIFSIPALVMMCVLAFIVTAAALLTPHFENIFKDFHTDLPMVTQWWLIFARFYLYGGWAVMAAAVIATPFLWAAVFPPPADPETRKWRRRWLRFIGACGILCFVIFVVIAMFAPMISLIQTVSSPQKH